MGCIPSRPIEQIGDSRRIIPNDGKVRSTQTPQADRERQQSATAYYKMNKLPGKTAEQSRMILPGGLGPSYKPGQIGERAH